MADAEQLRAVREALESGKAARDALKASQKLAAFKPIFGGADPISVSLGGVELLVHRNRRRRQGDRTQQALSAFLAELENPCFGALDTSRLFRRAADATAAVNGRDGKTSRIKFRLGLLQRDVSKVLVELRRMNAVSAGGRE